ncbi:hypothetical protein OIU74_022587 [Salix koriyanagi]|uniref:Uncharacterized protein n=1 Tax=Salix koriyanagi TaxID=2511006 RepID=A0A9Q0WKL8_9ROSI|nr:hypothetical protein OIU74_022587 [Salix koriyanagi]
MDYDVDDLDDGEGNFVPFEEEVGGDVLDIDAAPAMDEFQRPRMCKEGEVENKGIVELGAFFGGYIIKFYFGSLFYN